MRERDNRRNGEEDNEDNANRSCSHRDALLASFEEYTLTNGDQTGEHGVSTEYHLEVRMIEETVVLNSTMHEWVVSSRRHLRH